LTATPFDDFSTWARDLSISLSRAQSEKLALFVTELWTWQGKMNLVGVSTQDRLIRELLLDSLVPAPHIPRTGTLLDLGSGAGFPAIPLKICMPRVRFDLLESNAKKAAFLNEMIRILELERIRVIHARIEESKKMLDPQGYGTITARAAASLRQTLEWCGPHLERNGLLISFQGKSWRKALDQGHHVMKKQGLVLSRTLVYTLPGTSAERVILCFSKSGAP
jgi:16S rRNA (guanine527-N7)-methyltransferase